MAEGAPGSPYADWLRDRVERVQREAAAAEPVRSARAGAPQALQERIAAAVERLGDELVALARDLHAHPELAFEEQHAVEAVAKLLGAHGHDVELGAFGLPTALRADAGAGRPRVAVLAEYDALPELGHACGHNIICATAVGAFLALAEAADALGGGVALIGTPAEEGGGGKEYIARAGGFDDVDAVLMLHPGGWELGEHPWIGVRQVEVTYHGLAAHASATPFLGLNALDAVVTAYQGLAQLRQHILPTDRIHGIITEGGQRPNIVCDRAAAAYYLRSAEPQTLRILTDRAEQVFEAAALATGTELELHWDPCPVYLPVRHNRPLVARYAEHLLSRGRRVLPAGVVPGELTGSTDLGNVSVRIPAIHPTLAIAPPSVAIHSAEFAEWSVGEHADAGTIDGAVGLALTAADFLCDDALRADVSADFEEAGGAVNIDTLLG